MFRFNKILVFIILSINLISCDQKKSTTNPPEIVERDSDTVFNDVPGEHHLGKEALNYDLIEVLENIRKNVQFTQALREYGLADSILKEGSYTLFAPVDQAFEKSESKEISEEVIKAHIVSGVITREDIGSGKAVETLAGTQLDLKIVDDRIVINGKIKVSSENIQAENGVIHEIDELISPTSGSN